MKKLITKPKHFSVNDPVYGFTWDIYLGGELNAGIGSFAKKLNVPAWNGSNNNPSAHFFAYKYYRTGGIWTKVNPKYYPGLLAHECLHAVQYMFEYMQATINENTEEFAAYYLQFLMEEILLNSGY